MCSPNRLDPRSRFPFVIANLSLAVGLLLWNFRLYIHVNQNLLHGVCGFLLGISIALNLRWLIRARRHGEKRI
jgi:hypothetical protein